MGSGTTLAEITRLDMIKVALASLTSPPALKDEAFNCCKLEE
jgi:hypothetical protein